MSASLQDWNELMKNLEAWMNHYLAVANTSNTGFDRLPLVKEKAMRKAEKIDRILTELVNLDNCIRPELERLK